MSEAEDLGNTTAFSAFTEAPLRDMGGGLAVRGVVMIAGIIANILILIALYRNRTVWKESFSFILNIAVCDLLICLVVIPISIYTRSVPVTTRLLELMCRFRAFVSPYLNYCEMTGVLLATLDRFIFVFFPLHYYNIVTAKFCKVAIITSNVFCLIFNAIKFSAFQVVYGATCRPLLWYGKIACVAGLIAILLTALFTFILHSIVTFTACIRYHSKVKLNKVHLDPERAAKTSEVNDTHMLTLGSSLSRNKPRYANDVNKGEITSVVTGSDIPSIEARACISGSCQEGTSTSKCGRENQTEPKQSGCHELGENNDNVTKEAFIHRLVDETVKNNLDGSQPNASGNEIHNFDSLNTTHQISPMNLSSNSWSVQFKITRMLLLAISLYLLSYFPTTICKIIIWFKPEYFNQTLVSFLGSLWYLNLFGNPILYFISFADFRNSIFKKRGA